MFRKLGQFVLRYKFLIVAAWVIAAIWMVTQAPSLKDVAISETSEFLPKNAPSIVAQTALAQAFPEEGNQGTAIIVFGRAGGLTENDNTFARSFLDWLDSPAAPGVIGDVTSLFNRPGTESLFLSPDRSTMLAQVTFTSGPMEENTQQAVKTIRQQIAESALPPGLKVNVTGTTPISSDQRSALFEGVDRTTLVTVLLVIVVLLIIYRSPVAAMAPLFTISLAWVVARGLLGYLAVAGWKISSFVDTFIVVIIFGVGTDYCLFILSRFREELGRQGTRNEAIVVTMSAIGAVITASAATVIVALVFMALGDFVMLQTMGPAMALAVFVTLLAGLTLTPALIAIVGRYLFWPRHDEVSHESGKTWQRIAEIATTRSGLVTVVVVVVLLIPYLALPQMSRMFDVLAELPDKTDSVQGFNELTRGFDAGELVPAAILLTAPQGKILDDLSKIDQFTEQLAAAPEVQRVRSLLQPSGDDPTAALFHVDTQLTQVATGLDTLVKSLDDPAKAVQPSSGQQGSSMADLQAFLTDLGSLQSVASRPAYAEAVTRTKAVDAGLARLAEAGKLTTQLESLSKQMAQLAQTIKAASAAPASASASTASIAADMKTLVTYLSQMGQAFPTLAAQPAYQAALKDVQTLTTDLTAAQEALLVTNQLGLLAQQVQDLAKTLSTPLGLLSLSGASSQQMTLLAGYVADLGKAFPTIAASPAYQAVAARLMKLDAAGKQLLTNPPTDLTKAAADIQKEVEGLAADTLALRQTFATQNPTAQFVPQNMQALAGAQSGAALPDPARAAQQLADDLATLTTFARAQLPTATFMPTGIPLNDEMKRSLETVKQDATALQAAINRLAAETSAKPVHFLPQSMLNDPRTASLLGYFLSADGKSTRLTVVLKARPYSAQANKDIETLEDLAAKAGQAVGLEVVVGGVPVIMNDVQRTLSSDFTKIALFTIIGVFIVLVLLLRSLVAPIYLVLTVLLSYGTTLGISTIVFQDILGHDGVNTIIPIVVFVLLVALGADYNIFLMSRVREEAEGRGTRPGIRIASAYTGGIITSCGIILAGTFAAMMVAPIQTLFQIGFAVAAGVLVDTFVIRAVLVPAIAASLGERNWWPGKIKTQ
jgi:RND superfamily putative drug exporter